MPTGYAYIRYSTRRQGADDKDSVTRQKASIRAIAARHEVEIPEKNFFYEDGVSAFTGANAKGGKLKDIIDLIDALTIQEGDFIFVESIDRLSRQRLLQTKDLVYGILKKGVSIVTTIDGYVYRLRDEKDALHQDIMLSVISTRAHEESSTKSTRRKSAWKKAKEDAEKGIVFNPNRLPYGVLYDEESNSLVVDKEAQKEFEFIFENLKRQGVTSTIKKVNQFSKINWTQARLKDIFETKYVLGFYMSNKKVDGKLIFDRFIENYYPKIIEPTLFLEAKEAMTNRKVKRHSGRVTEDNINIFRHSCFCARCGKSLVFMNNFNSKGRRYFYTTCSQNIENGSCKNRYRYDLAVKLFFDIMQEFDRLNSKKVNLDPIDIDQYKNLDEATLKEIESVNKSLEAIDEGSAGVISLAKRFIDLSKEKVMADRKTKKKIKELTDKKNLLEISVSNLNKSIEVITNGIIPASVMKKLSEEEAKLQELKEEIEKLTISDGVVKGQKMEFTSLNQAMKFFKTEEGRLSIINFLTSNNIKFSFDFVSDVLYATAYIGENEIGSMSTIYDNKAAPLGIYGFDNLGNVFTN